MRQEVSTPRPLISVVFATYNEAHYVRSSLRSILEQEGPGFDIELLAIDGNSDDGTREILNEYSTLDPRLRVLVNEKRRAPFAFNLGLKKARGEFICIFGAHTIYRKDYIAICLRELIAHGAAGCGGRVITAPSRNTLQACLAAWAISHPFGSSRKSFRTQSEGFVDTVNYPVMRRALLTKAGGYDELLLRNQDNDLNQKLRGMGHKLYCTWKTSCFYSPKESLKELLDYMRITGFWNVISFTKNPSSMAVRHFVPFIFLVTLFISSLLALVGVFLPVSYRVPALIPLIVLVGLHLSLGFLAGLQVAVREKSPGALWLPLVFLSLHVAYGYGTVSGVFSQLKTLLRSSESLVASRVRNLFFTAAPRPNNICSAENKSEMQKI